MTPDLLSVIVRGLGFVALFQAAGAAFFLATFGRSLGHARAAIERLGRTSAVLGALLVLAHLALDAGRLSGDFQGLWDPDLQRLAWFSGSGRSQMQQIFGLLVVLVALWTPGKTHARWASAGAVLSISGFLITGHTTTHSPRPVLAPLLAVHLVVVAFWFGSLIPLALTARRESRTTAVAVLRRFSAVAAVLVPLILVAGVTMAWLLAGSLRILLRPYGELLLAKIAGFGVLMGLAAYNRWRVTPVFAATGSDAALRGSITAEYLLIVGVLGITAVLTAFLSPD
jgi:putative copper export protein